MTHLQTQTIAVRRQDQGTVLEDTLVGTWLALFEEQTVQDLQSLGTSSGIAVMTSDDWFAVAACK